MPDAPPALKPPARPSRSRTIVRVRLVPGPGDERALDDLADAIRALLDEAARASVNPARSQQDR